MGTEMKQTTALIICIFGLANFAAAQTYKCNIGGKSVYSDTPCGVGEKVIPAGTASSQASELGGPVEFGAQVCRDAIPRHILWKDPESLRLGPATGGKMVVIDFADRKLAARSYTLLANSKNAYGAYTGDRPVTCYTSEDGRRLLKIEGIDPNQ
jgi:hypothetical protein